MALLVYARTSTAQLTGGVDRQHDDLRAAGVERIWCDVGVSGKTILRPEWDALWAYAREDDVLVVIELSRISRSLSDAVRVLEEAAARGIGIRSLTQGIDTSAAGDPMARVVVAMTAALAEVERDILVERTRSGLASARLRGRLGGRPVCVDAERLAAARQLIDSRQIVSVASALGVGRSSLYRATEGERAAPPRRVPDDRAGADRPVPARPGAHRWRRRDAHARGRVALLRAAGRGRQQQRHEQLPLVPTARPGRLGGDPPDRDACSHLG